MEMDFEQQYSESLHHPSVNCPLPNNQIPALPYKVLRGFKIPRGSNEDLFSCAIDYQSRPGDIFIVSYPKCGTTWMQHIVYLLMNEGRPAENMSTVVSAIPFVEQDGWPEGVEPLALKYHLPYRLTPFSKEAKYIYVARNPKDASVSFYHFLKNLPGYRIESFDYFFDAFMSGQVPYDDFAEHVIEWASVRHLPNVLFVTYESLSRKKEEEIIKLANFLEIDLNKGDHLQDVIKYSSFDYMRQLAAKDNFMRGYLKEGTRQKELSCDKDEPIMMRRGVVGDWRNYFTAEQNKRMNAYFRRATRKLDLEEMWRTDMDL